MTFSYAQSLLKARIIDNFITLPQCTIEQKYVTKALSELKPTYLIVKTESHKNEGIHIHILFRLRQRTMINVIHKIFLSLSNNHKMIGGLIDYKPVDIPIHHPYILKEESSLPELPPSILGDLPTKWKNALPKSPSEPKSKKKTLLHYDYAYALSLSEDPLSNEEARINSAMDYVKQSDPISYAKDYKKLNETFTELSKKVSATSSSPRLYYDPPDFSKHNVTLRKGPQEFLVNYFLNHQPTPRRIWWIKGEPGCGKSYLTNYLDNHENYPYDVFHAGTTASHDSVVNTYDQQGIIIWDLPKSFDFINLGKPLSSTIEKFSDFGQNLTSKKYNGKTIQNLSHVLVFSNDEPLIELQHRDLHYINWDKNTLTINNKEIPLLDTYENTIKHIPPEQTVLTQYYHVDEELDTIL